MLRMSVWLEISIKLSSCLRFWKKKRLKNSCSIGLTASSSMLLSIFNLLLRRKNSRKIRKRKALMLTMLLVRLSRRDRIRRKLKKLHLLPNMSKT